MFKDKIKITNVSDHKHGIKREVGGNIVAKTILSKKSVYVTMEQFYDLWTSTKDFKRGILSVDLTKFDDETLMELGIDLKEIKSDILFYNDETILKIFKGSMPEFHKFMTEVSNIETNDFHSYAKRIFDLARNYEGLSKIKADRVEKVTNMSFKITQDVEDGLKEATKSKKSK